VAAEAAGQAVAAARVPASTLRGWEHDRGFPNLAALLRLAEALVVSIEQIAAGVADPADDEPEPALGAAPIAEPGAEGGARGARGEEAPGPAAQGEVTGG
jgi:hypothetical protein